MVTDARIMDSTFMCGTLKLLDTADMLGLGLCYFWWGVRKSL